MCQCGLQLFKLHYADRLEQRGIRAGQQFIVHTPDKSEVFVTVNVYPTTGKIMVQPGQMGEDHLLGFLGEFQVLSTKRPYVGVSAVCNQEAESTCETATCIPLLIVTPATPNVLGPVHNHEGSPDQPEPDVTMPSRSTGTVSESQTQCTRIVINEMLCFVQSRLNCLPLLVIVKLVTDFYTLDTIIDNKKLLFDLVNPANRRYIKRKVGCKEDVMDICKLMLEAE